MARRLIALDEACLKANGLEYWVYAVIDVDRNEIWGFIHLGMRLPQSSSYVRP